MRKLLVMTSLIAIGILPGGGSAKETVTIEQVDYHGWTGAYRMTNGAVELVYVPQIGRIMRYGYAGGRNVLWENPKLAGQTADPASAAKEWPNFGGDKLWQAPQARWGWPPDPALDGGAARVELLSGGRLRVTGRPSARAGVRFDREISLDRSGSGVTLKNMLVNTSEQPVEWSVWEVAQIDDPARACLPFHAGGRFPAGYLPFADNPPAPDRLQVGEAEVCLRRHPNRGSKIGGDSPAGWVAGVVGDLRFQVSARHEGGREYPDGGCSLEIWSNPDPLRYMELEVLSPIRKVQPRKSTAFTTRWNLSRLK